MKSAVERASESTWKSLNWCFNIYGDHVFTLYKINVFFHVATPPGPLACPSRSARPHSLSLPHRLAPQVCPSCCARPRNCLKLIRYIPRERFLDHPPAPPPINFVHESYRKCLNLIKPVAAALGPLVCPSRSARPRKCLNLT